MLTETFDMCQKGMAVMDGHQLLGYARKPTKIATYSAVVQEAVRGRCPGDHVHASLRGGWRCRDAAKYPMGF